MQNITLTVEGMSCNHCVKSVEGAVAGLGATGKVDLAARKVEVTFDETKVTVDQIKAAIEDQGYDVV
ncbi:copper ion binding protein [Paenibacillus barengoltzii]|uniref:Copper ion binding protein n=1 Tax=Paenibacillus barengoltzii G22 TaxID=1235795 RepID=R9L765_9BACL|nr:copper ion binding protein [Paenibacillus barengoltzii]EOS54515.1 copper ion binding protein [Paenibacillus barengoltzii G22]